MDEELTVLQRENNVRAAWAVSLAFRQLLAARCPRAFKHSTLAGKCKNSARSSEKCLKRCRSVASFFELPLRSVETNLELVLWALGQEQTGPARSLWAGELRNILLKAPNWQLQHVVL
jgi:hypothetical protein